MSTRSKLVGFDTSAKHARAAAEYGEPGSRARASEAAVRCAGVACRRRSSRWGWHWKHGRWYGELNLRCLNRPMIRFEWDNDDDAGYVALEWGNGNSDPVWAIVYGRFFRAPAWLVRRWQREWDQQQGERAA